MGKDVKSVAEIVKSVSGLQISKHEKEKALEVLKKLEKATRVRKKSENPELKIQEIEELLGRKLSEKEKEQIRQKYTKEGYDYPTEYTKSVVYYNVATNKLIQLIESL